MSPPIWYSRWDGSQRIDDLDADQLLDAMSDDLLSDGDPWSALRRLFQRGARTPDGANLPGLQDLLNRLRRQRQQQLDRYDLSSVLDDIKQKLDKILQTEREGIERRVADARDRARRGEAPDSFRQAMEQAAAEHRKTLDEMPESPAGRIQGLQGYEFMDPDAHRLFWELMKGLQQQMLQPFLSNMQKALGNMTPQDFERMREMLRDLNRMLQERAEGREPDFEAFKQKWGQNFPGVESLDELLDQIGRRMAAMQSLMQSLSDEQRAQLDEMMRSLFMQDERLEAAMRQLGM
ncbi:MAG TPA: VWA domain-containing protein, partial [Methylomirabilota bacterium]|nr:VWA domain-containing protein [Methylomirabilota bacterium]